MAVQRSKTITCDVCRKAILDGQLINAMTYGAMMHVECLKAMSAFELIKVLTLDDILLQATAVVLASDRDWDPDGVKVAYEIAL